MDSRLKGLPAIPASSRVSRLIYTSHHIMLTCPSLLSSPNRYKRQNSDSIQFTSDRACCARESSSLIAFSCCKLVAKAILVTNSKFRSIYTATFPLSIIHTYTLYYHVTGYLHLQVLSLMQSLTSACMVIYSDAYTHIHTM